MKTKNTSALTVIELLAVIAILVGFTIICFQPYYESQTYNRLTGAHTTWWDAIWVELRVQDQPRNSYEAPKK